MATTRIATVEFSANKNCFVALPVSWMRDFSKKQDVIFEVAWGDNGKAYVSWAGEYIRQAGLTSPDPDAVIQLNGLFANKLGLRHGQEVLLSPVNAILPCSRVFVQPASTDDWEILELNANYIESNLLNQVRVVWKNQTLPIWIDKKICIFIKIGASEPHAPCIKLEPSTELVVAPKTRLQSSTSTQRLTDSHLAPSLPTKAERNLYSDTSQALPDSRLSSASSKESGFSFGSTFSRVGGDQEASTTMTDKSFLSSSHESGFETAATTPAYAPLDLESVSLGGAIPWSYRVWSTIKWLLFRYGDTHFGNMPNTDNEEDARRKMAAEFWKDIRIIARVQPMLDKQKGEERGTPSSGSVTSLGARTPTPNRPSSLPISTLRSKKPHQSSPASNLSSSSSTNSYTHLMQPTTVYLSSNSDTYFQNQSSDYSSKEDRISSNDFVVFLAHLTKLLSPRERKEELNKKLAEAQRKTQEGSTVNGNQPQKLAKNNQGGDSKTKSANQHKAPVTSCVVRCIIHTKELKGHRARQPNNIYSSTTFDDSSIRWFLQIPELLRRQLGLECTSKVQLRPVIEPPVPIHSIMLHPLFEMPEIGKEGAVKAFSHWLSCVSCMISPIPICRFGTLVKFPISKTGESMGEFLISVNDKMTETGEDPYYLLHPLVARKVTVTIGEMITETNKPSQIAKLPYWSESDLDGTVEGYKLRELGGVGDLSKQAIQHIHTALMTRPLSSQMCQSLPGIQQGGLLVCGPSGCGKTTLARAICKQVSDWPSLAYATVVECKPLKGKRVDVVRRALEEAFNEASWRQPSVILLDDLDQVTRAPLGPEEEIGPEAVFNAHVAQVVRDVLTTEINEHSKVCVIATARSKGSLHGTLTNCRGSHFFQSLLEIQPLNKVQRIEIFVSVIQSKVDVQMQTIDILDLDHLASRTEGFVARDIVTIVERAIHAGCSREIALEKRPPPVPISKDPDHPYDEILLTNEDFDVALNQYTPSSLRDVPLHSAGKLGWEDIGGLRNVKQALIETLQLPAKYPGLFASCPLRLRSGLLLYGPPGTGKTLLGGIVAKECGLNFISIKGPELLSKYIGASEQGVRDLFGRAQSAKPCILFFDEFDSLAPRRGHDSTGVTDRVVNQLLTQLDGVEGLEGVYIIGATSRPDLIDPALLRPGRLDKCLFCPIPTADERVEIVQALSRNLPLSPEVDLRAVALQCDYFTGADLKALLYNAQLEAIHNVHAIAKSSTEADFEPLGAMDPSRCRSMDANDWKLTFLESFASESEMSQFLNDSTLAQLQGLGEESGTDSPNTAEQAVFTNKDLDLENGNASDSSLGSLDSLRLNLQDLNASTGQVKTPGQGSLATTPGQGSYVMTPEERRRSIEMVLKASYGGKRPSLKDLADWKMLYEHGRRSPRPLLSGDSIENEEVPGPLEEPDSSGNQPIIYMPTLRDGVVDPNKETQEKLNSQVAVVKENYNAQMRGSQANIPGASKEKQASAITITHAHLMKAVSTMKPSVSATERARYQRLYDSFVQSRGGDFTPVQQTDEKRATLA